MKHLERLWGFYDRKKALQRVVLFPHFNQFISLMQTANNKLLSPLPPIRFCQNPAFSLFSFPFSHTHNSTPNVIVSFLFICQETLKIPTKKNEPNFRAGKYFLICLCRESWSIVISASWWGHRMCRLVFYLMDDTCGGNDRGCCCCICCCLSQNNKFLRRVYVRV